MNTITLSPHLIGRLEDIYEAMEKAYDDVAGALNFSCSGCSDNCCDSYFLHHTYIEWSYLWHGLNQLPTDKLETLVERAHRYIVDAEKARHNGERPQIMCPLNEDGWCLVYKYRLMVCRTHGVPAEIIRPDGKRITFPGCFRCQERAEGHDNVPMMQRTPMLRDLASLENEFLENRRHLYPKVKLSIAEMLVKGPPALRGLCRR